jgi:DNA-binding NtrC family response regulator
MAGLDVYENPRIARAIIPTRVLVVDDEPLIRWSICTALASDGYDPVSASNPEDAGRVATRWPPPKVVLFDLRNPDHALDFMAAIRCVYPACRFAVMTTVRERPDWLEREGVEWIEKPFDLAAVVRIIGALATCPAGASAPLRGRSV